MDTVLIKYSGEQIENYICMSEFLSMCGFMVAGERLIGETESKGINYDVIVLLSDKFQEIEENQITLRKKDRSKGNIEILVEKLYEKGKINSSEVQILLMLREIYKNGNLRNMTHCGQCFYFALDEAKVVYKEFEKAYKKIVALQEEDSDNNYLWYARAYCVRMMLELADQHNGIKHYAAVKVIETLNEIVNRELEESRHTAFYFMMGTLAEVDKELKNSAPKYYEECIKKMADNRCKSLVYYRWGRNLERQKRFTESIMKYENALRYDPDNYFARYKIAQYYDQIRNDYEKAEEQYRNICDYLELLEQSGILQPTEIEYMYKVYYCLVCMQKQGYGDISTIKPWLKKLQELDEKKLEDFPFFESFYKEDAQKYYTYMKTRMRYYIKHIDEYRRRI